MTSADIADEWASASLPGCRVLLQTTCDRANAFFRQTVDGLGGIARFADAAAADLRFSYSVLPSLKEFDALFALPNDTVDLFFGRSGQRASKGRFSWVRSADTLHRWCGEEHAIYSIEGASGAHRWPGRLAREILCQAVFPGVRIHGGCVHTPGGAFLVVGDKGAGKTTLVLSLLLEGASYVANDRVQVHVDAAGSARAAGLPVSVRIGAEYLEAHPRIAARCRAAAQEFDDLNRDLGRGAKLELTVSELTGALDLRVADEVPLAGVIAPRLELGREGVTVTPFLQKRDLLRRSVLSPDPAFPAYCFVPRPKQTDRVFETLVSLPWVSVTGAISTGHRLMERCIEACQSQARPSCS